MSKIRVALAAIAMALAVGSVEAREAPDGGSKSADGSVIHELFDRGDSYFWVLMHDPKNDGYNCSVSFVTTKGTYSIHGPMDAEMAKSGTGSLWFSSPAVPRGATRMERVTLAVHSEGAAMNWPAIQTTIGKDPHGTLMVSVQIASVLKEKIDTNDLSVSLAGAEVFGAKLMGLQEAYGRLGDCMAAKPPN